MAARAAVLLALAWPLSLHCAVLLDAPQWGPRLTAIAAALAATLWAVGTRRFLPALAVALAAAAAAILAPQFLLYAPPVLINLALAAVFGASLRAPREPLIATFARQEHPDLPADLALYTRRLTLLWTVLFAAMAAIALALAFGGSLETWSVFTNVVSYVLVATLFAGEYTYRRWRYRQYRHASLPEFVRNVRAAGLFRRR